MRDFTTPILHSCLGALSSCVQTTSPTFIDGCLFFNLQLWWTRHSVKHSLCQRFQNCETTVVKYFSRLDISCTVCEPSARGWLPLPSVFNNRRPITSCNGVSDLAIHHPRNLEVANLAFPLFPQGQFAVPRNWLVLFPSLLQKALCWSNKMLKIHCKPCSCYLFCCTHPSHK